jgi:hypothetical protein
MHRLAFTFFVMLSLVQPGSAQPLHDRNHQMSSVRHGSAVRGIGHLVGRRSRRRIELDRDDGQALRRR